jgi:hypothetical protein
MKADFSLRKAILTARRFVVNLARLKKRLVMGGLDQLRWFYHLRILEKPKSSAEIL